MFAAYQLLLWFGARERQALHLAAAAIFIALALAVSGELAEAVLPAGLFRWRGALAAALPLLALVAPVSLARGYLGGAIDDVRIRRALKAMVVAALVGAATTPSGALCHRRRGSFPRSASRPLRQSPWRT